jgi:hypothetical protein
VDWLPFITFMLWIPVTATAQQRFLVALRRREPRAAAPDDDVLVAIGRRPLSFIPIMASVTGARLSAFARSWPYPEVERARRWAIASIVVSLILFIWFAVAG